MPDPLAPRRVPSIRMYLVALVAVALVPMIAIAAALVWHQSSVQEQELGRSLTGGAEALSLAVDAECESFVRMLETLAESLAVSGDDMQAFHELAVRAAAKSGVLFVSMFTPDRIQVMNTAVPFGKPLPQPLFAKPTIADDPLAPDIESIERVFTTKAPTYSRLFRSLSLHRNIFTVNIPVLRDGEIAYVLNVGLDPAIIAALLVRENKFGDSPAAVLDPNGYVIARSVDGVAHTGESAPLLRGVALTRSGAVSLGERTDGSGLRFAVKRSSVTGWQSVMAAERATLQERQQNLAVALGLLVVGIVVAMLSAGALAARIRTSVARLQSAAQGGEPFSDDVPTIREFSVVENSLRTLAQTQRNEAQERERRLVAELQKQQAELENRRKDVYLATLAHELRNPLSPIRNAVALLQRRDPDPATLAWARDIIARQVAQMARLLDDLLEVSRIAQGKVQLRRAALDLRGVVASAAETAKPALQAAEQSLELELPEQPAWVIGDETRLIQVVANLLGNAAKYGERRGVVSVSVRRDGADVVVSVKDRGSGIPPELLDRIFEPFAQAQETLDRAQGGLGIGLALVKGLVELHEGTVSARSAGPGTGAEFVVALPASAEPPRPPAPAPQPTVRLDDSKILVVDDNADNAQTIGELVRVAGATVRVAYDGASALAIADTFAPDVVVLDIGMPGLTGYDVALALRARASAARLVAISGWGQQADRSRAAAAGFDCHLTKPVDPDRLLQTMDALRRRV